MATEEDFAKELNALIKRLSTQAATRRTSPTNCFENQTPCSGITTSKSILKRNRKVEHPSFGSASSRLKALCRLVVGLRFV